MFAGSEYIRYWFRFASISKIRNFINLRICRISRLQRLDIYIASNHQCLPRVVPMVLVFLVAYHSSCNWSTECCLHWNFLFQLFVILCRCCSWSWCRYETSIRIVQLVQSCHDSDTIWGGMQQMVCSVWLHWVLPIHMLLKVVFVLRYTVRTNARLLCFWMSSRALFHTKTIVPYL